MPSGLSMLLYWETESAVPDTCMLHGAARLGSCYLSQTASLSPFWLGMLTNAAAAAAGHCRMQPRSWCRDLYLLPATHLAAAAVQLLRTRIQATAGLAGKGHSQGHPSDRSSHTAGAPKQKQHFKEAVLKLHSEAQVCQGSLSVLGAVQLCSEAGPSDECQEWLGL